MYAKVMGKRSPNLGWDEKNEGGSETTNDRDDNV